VWTRVHDWLVFDSCVILSIIAIEINTTMSPTDFNRFLTLNKWTAPCTRVLSDLIAFTRCSFVNNKPLTSVVDIEHTWNKFVMQSIVFEKPLDSSSDERWSQRVDYRSMCHVYCEHRSTKWNSFQTRIVFISDLLTTCSSWAVDEALLALFLFIGYIGRYAV
jgi:hypothetical protein